MLYTAFRSLKIALNKAISDINWVENYFYAVCRPAIIRLSFSMDKKRLLFLLYFLECALLQPIGQS